jgi:pimeloyl-ACP methyl ester carboxylesterase
VKTRTVDIDWAGRPVRIEHTWVGERKDHAPLIVFLHEGLGSVSMWRDFPERLCRAANCRGLLYSRPGYGHSTPRGADEHWGPDFMHRQAREVLPSLLAALGVDTGANPPWLFGHSDGGSIALLFAAMFPDQLRGAIVVAPHILVEDISITSIEQAREAYLQADLRPRLARHHADVDSAFWGWNDIWLSPAFRAWKITEAIREIRVPLLAVQGLDDEYGTLLQIRELRTRVPQTQLLELADCGHSPQRDQPEALIAASCAFIEKHAFIQQHGDPT